jgi:hypothetical protein
MSIICYFIPMLLKNLFNFLIVKNLFIMAKFNLLSMESIIIISEPKHFKLLIKEFVFKYFNYKFIIINFKVNE